MADEDGGALRALMQSPVGFLRLASTLVSRAGLARAAGKSFGGKRDLYNALGYPDSITLQMYREMYERGGIASRIVELEPRATWRGGWSVFDDGDPDSETDFEKGWRELADRLQIWATFTRVDILAGLGDYAVLLIGGPGPLDQPLERATAEQIAYVQPYSQEDATVKSLVEDQEDPRFGEPELYTLDRVGGERTDSQTPGSSTVATRRKNQKQQDVHWSRVIHVADGKLDDQINGQPRLRDVYNLLLDLEKVRGGGAEAFWLRANPGFITKFDEDLEMKPDDIKALKDQMDAFVHGMRRHIAQRNAETTAISAEVADFGGPSSAIIEQIAATKGYPQRILTGSERGELASSEDRSNWNDAIKDRREEFGEPEVVRPFVDRMIALGALPTPREAMYEVGLPDIDNLDELQKGELAETMANVNKAYGGIVIAADEIRDLVWDLGPLEDLDMLAEVGDEDAEAEVIQIAARLAAARKKKARGRTLTRRRRVRRHEIS